MSDQLCSLIREHLKIEPRLDGRFSSAIREESGFFSGKRLSVGEIGDRPEDGNKIFFFGWSFDRGRNQNKGLDFGRSLPSLFRLLGREQDRRIFGIATQNEPPRARGRPMFRQRSSSCLAEDMFERNIGMVRGCRISVFMVKRLCCPWIDL